MKPKEFLVLALLALGAILVHGYHPAAEDADLYLPAVEKILHPELFPFNSQFFESHAQLTLFPNLVAASVRLTRLSLDMVLFLWQVASIFLFLLGCWELTGRCFTHNSSRWGGVTLIASLLTLPVAGTALYFMDQYTNPRNVAAFASIFAIVSTIDKKYLKAVILLAFAAAIHPLMSAFAVSFCLLLAGIHQSNLVFATAVVLVPMAFRLKAPPTSYHAVALTHSYFYLNRWHWYEWLGVIGPLVVLYWFSFVARSKQFRNMELLCRTLIIYELLYLPIATIVSVSGRLESLARLQPMRSLYLLYIVMFLFAGGLLAEHVLQKRVWRWLTLFCPLCTGMFLAQRALFPASAHIEFPGIAPKNHWAQAFEWIRHNTPTDAIFALDPSAMKIPLEDENGFEAIAQRSRLADEVRDGGAASMFPVLADEWSKQIQAQKGWRTFQLQDFRRLQKEFGVTWVVLLRPAPERLECPYHNEAVIVCRMT